jgi:hypothetical protein
LPILLSAGLVAFQRLAHYRVEVLRWLDLDNACSVLNARVSLVGDVAGRGDWQCCRTLDAVEAGFLGRCLRLAVLRLRFNRVAR